MDIQPALSNLPLALSKVGDGGLNLKLNQIVDAKVIESQIMLDSLKVKINDKIVDLQAKQPLTLTPGQPLQLQVVKLLPNPEFLLVSSLLDKSTTRTLPPAAETIRLTVVTNSPAPASNLSNQTSANTLNVGQQLTATVVSNQDGTLTLQLAAADKANATVNVLTLNQKQLVIPVNAEPAKSPSNPIPLKPGATITLTVLQGGNTPQFAVAPAIENPTEVIQQALKTLLPIQGAPTALVQQLQTTLPHLQANPTVAETLKQVAREILLNMPDKSLLSTPEQVKQSIKQSGLFLESKLSALLAGKPDVSLQGDFKLKLGQLIELIQKELSQPAVNSSNDLVELLQESLQKARAALAGLTLDQLNSLPREESPKQVWTLELPFFNDQSSNSVQIEIEQDTSANEAGAEKSWSVNITITPPGLATIHCKVSCYDGAVNTRFWSDASDTVARISANLDYLKQQFEKNGLTAGFMDAHQGKPSNAEHRQAGNSGLLHEKA